MRKAYISSLALLCPIFSICQSLQLKTTAPKAVPNIAFFESSKPSTETHKAFNDTLWYFDCDSAGLSASGYIPSSWTNFDGTGNNVNWIWTDQAPGGQYSTNIPALNSPTASNGFYALRMDFYNTPLAGIPITMNNFIQTPAISITPKPSVLLRFTQSFRTCCSVNDELKVSVSTDGNNWTNFDAMLGEGPNTIFLDTLTEINISSVVANSSTVYLRFHAEGPSHYFWMIDDIHLVEGPDNSLLLNEYVPIFDRTHDLSPIYRVVPYGMLDPVDFEARVLSYGALTQTNVKVDVSIDHERYFNGNAGLGNVHLASTPLNPQLPSLVADTFNLLPSNYFIANTAGTYSANFVAHASQQNQTANRAIGTYSFAISDTAMGIARQDASLYSGSVGPNSFANGGNIGDRYGILVSALSPATLTSVSYYIGANNNNVGARFVPRVWEYDETQTQAGNFQSAFTQVASSPFPYTLSASELDGWLTVDLFPTFQVTPGKQYVVGFEVVGGATGNPNGIGVFVGRDQGQERFANRQSNASGLISIPAFVYLNSSNPGWGAIDDVPAIFANFGSLSGSSGPPVGIRENAKTELKVFPNPSKGQITIQLSSNERQSYRLLIENMVGQIVYDEQIQLEHHFQKILDFSDLEKGVYQLHLSNQKRTIRHKVVLQ